MSSTRVNSKWSFNNINAPAYFTPSSTEFLEHQNSVTFVEYKRDTDEVEKILNNYRKAAVIHKLVRSQTKQLLHQNVKYWDIVSQTEEMILKFSNCGDRKTYFKNPLSHTSGIAFPVGISVNEIAAHDTSYPEDSRTLSVGDIVKMDIGVIIDGCIIDSAFTHIVDEEDSPYAPLLDATRDATYGAICMAGVDARLIEISELIKETIESYEIELGNKIIPVSPVGLLGGHNILRNKVHGDKLILCEPHEVQEGFKMDDGEIYAIETYATTGNGQLTKKGDITHFSFDESTLTKKGLKQFTKHKSGQVEEWIFNRGKLPFSFQWCEEAGFKNVSLNFRKQLSQQLIMGFPPLTDTLHSKISMLEHTIHVTEGGTEILSFGDDY